MSLTKRIIPCLDVDRGRVVKGVKFVEEIMVNKCVHASADSITYSYGDQFTSLLRTDPVTGAETRLVSLEVTRHLRPLRLQRLVRMHEIGSPHAALLEQPPRPVARQPASRPRLASSAGVVSVSKRARSGSLPLVSRSVRRW